MILRPGKGCNDPKNLEWVLSVLDRRLYGGGHGGIVLHAGLRPETAANTAESRSVLGTKSKISGGNIMTSVPTLAGIEAPADATIAIDIKSAYDNKNGAPSADAPKVFFKYFYVNTATGEKLGSAVLSA